MEQINKIPSDGDSLQEDPLKTKEIPFGGASFTEEPLKGDETRGASFTEDPLKKEEEETSGASFTEDPLKGDETCGASFTEDPLKKEEEHGDGASVKDPLTKELTANPDSDRGSSLCSAPPRGVDISDIPSVDVDQGQVASIMDRPPQSKKLSGAERRKRKKAMMYGNPSQEDATNPGSQQGTSSSSAPPKQATSSLYLNPEYKFKLSGAAQRKRKKLLAAGQYFDPLYAMKRAATSGSQPEISRLLTRAPPKQADGSSGITSDVSSNQNGPLPRRKLSGAALRKRKKMMIMMAMTGEIEKSLSLEDVPEEWKNENYVPVRGPLAAKRGPPYGKSGPPHAKPGSSHKGPKPPHAKPGSSHKGPKPPHAKPGSSHKGPKPPHEGNGRPRPQQERLVPLHKRPGPAHKRTAPSYDISGTSYERFGPSYGQSGPSYERSGPSYERSGPSYERSGPSYERSGPSYERSGPTYERSGPSYERSVFSYERSDPSYGRSVLSYERSRPLHERPGLTHERSGPSHALPGLPYERPGPSHAMSGPNHALPGPPHAMSGPNHAMSGPLHAMPGSLHVMPGVPHPMSGPRHAMSGALFVTSGPQIQTPMSGNTAPINRPMDDPRPGPYGIPASAMKSLRDDPRPGGRGNDLTIKMTIIKENYPDERIVDEEIPIIQREILRKLDAMPFSQPLPLLKHFYLADGGLVYLCGSQETCQWLVRAIDRFHLRDGSTLKAIRPKNFSRPIKVAFRTRDSCTVDPQKLLIRLQTFNPELRTENWIIHQSSAESQGQRVLLSIDIESADSIRNSGYKAFTGIDQGTFQFLTDP